MVEYKVRRTHIIIRIRLQLSGASEEIFQDGEDAIAHEETLQACQKPEHKLDLPPVALIDVLLKSIAQLLENFFGKFWLLGIGLKDNRSDERDF